METSIEAFFFEPDHLSSLAEQYATTYRTASPFPHIVIDDFLPEDVVQRVLDEFPSPKDEEWFRWDARTERKLQTTAEHGIGPFTRQLLNQFNAAAMIDFLEALTGIEHLVPDPHYFGGGLHQIERGGFLKVHADFNHHARLQLERRLNLLLYLNRDWREEYGGHLELWNRDMTAAVDRIAPVFNRCVIFNTTDFSYHGHPEPLTCPEGSTRKSIALYYYSKGRPPEEIASAHSTLFQRRPGETRLKSAASMRDSLKRLVPPIITDAVRARRKPPA
jgi:hypothetical protein